MKWEWEKEVESEIETEQYWDRREKEKRDSIIERGRQKVWNKDRLRKRAELQFYLPVAHEPVHNILMIYLFGWCCCCFGIFAAPHSAMSMLLSAEKDPLSKHLANILIPYYNLFLNQMNNITMSYTNLTVWRAKHPRGEAVTHTHTPPQWDWWCRAIWKHSLHVGH